MLKDDAKEQIRSRTDMAAVVGRYVTLKGRGDNLSGLCPFHKEKTPSFTVNPSQGVYYCFGCHKGGDVFNFVMEIENVDFPEALKMLAEDAGIELDDWRRDSQPSYQPSQSSRSSTSAQAPPPARPPSAGRAAKTDLLSVHGEAANFFYQSMKKHPQAIDYFKSRGLSGEIVKEFRLGYAPPGWSELYDYFKGRKVPQARLTECGLVVSKESGAVYDRFRDRIIFPLFDLSGRVIAFAGRGLNADAQPKYLNSPETPLYRKSGVLYGMHKSRDAVRELGYMMIVEGYMDYLSLYQAGIRNAAAVSGTAFTEEHANIIKRFTQKVILVFDGDRAGVSAAARAAVVLAPFKLEVQILTLPGDDDPDSFVKREGAEAFLTLLQAAHPASDFLIERAMADHDGSSLGKSRVLDELMPYAHALADEIVRADFLSALAVKLRLERHQVSDRFNKSAPSRPSAGGQYGGGAGSGGVDGGVDGAGRIVLGALEERFLRLLITAPEHINEMKEFIKPEIFIDTPAANIYSIILEAYAQTGDMSGLSAFCSDDPVTGRLISMLAVTPAAEENIGEELEQKGLLLLRKFYKSRMAGLSDELRNCSELDKGRLLRELKGCGERLRELEVLLQG